MIMIPVYLIIYFLPCALLQRLVKPGKQISKRDKSFFATRRFNDQHTDTDHKFCWPSNSDGTIKFFTDLPTNLRIPVNMATYVTLISLSLRRSRYRSQKKKKQTARIYCAHCVIHNVEGNSVLLKMTDISLHKCPVPILGTYRFVP